MESEKGEIDGKDMTAGQKQLIEQEDKYRRMFAEQRDSKELDDPHLLLFNVFSGDEKKWNFATESADEKQLPHVLKQWRDQDVKDGTKSIVQNEEQYKQNWEEFTKGMFKGMDWSNVFCAGGAILANLLSGEKVKEQYADSDIDLFIYGCDAQRANEKLKHIHEVLTRNTSGGGNVIRTRRTVTLINSYPYRHTQVILKIYKSPAEVLLGFDVDCCCFGYDGNHVWSMERGRRSIVQRYNLVNKTRRSATYEKRLLKYAKRGIAVVTPKLDRSKLDERIFYKKPWETHGLGRLLVYNYRADHPELFSVQSWREKDGPESDYSGDLDIPWGPGWQSSHILEKLNAQDKSQFFAHRFRVARSSAQSKKLREEVSHEPVPGVPGGDRDVTEPPEHKHLFITGIDQVIEGGHFWCEFCNKEMPMLPDQENKEDPAWNNFVPKKVIWVTESPAYQDFDNGFRRRMITGSFNPILDEDWDQGVYAPEGHKRGPLPHEGREITPNVLINTPTPKWVPRVSPAAQTKIPGTSSFPTKTKTTSSAAFISAEERGKENFGCDVCSARFYSQNQLRRHLRESGHQKSTTEEGSSAGGRVTLESVLQPGSLEDKDPKTRALLLISVCHQAGRITDQERDTLKSAFVRNESLINAAVQVFMVDRDIKELVDTFKRLASNIQQK